MLEVHQNYPRQITFWYQWILQTSNGMTGEKEKEKERGNKQENRDFDYESLRNREIRWH
jgi:hypothetical protein